MYNNHNTTNRPYFSQQQNAFLNPNITSSLMKTITSILTGENIKQNQQKLHQLRTQPQYPLILCEILTKLHKTTLTKQNIFQMNKKHFILLEIKKNADRLKNQQCWWLLRDVYFVDNDKTSKMIREICLLFQKEVGGENGVRSDTLDVDNNYLEIFFMVNLENLGLVGIVRYLVLVHGLLGFQFKNLQNGAIIKYGEVIVKKILDTLQWDLPTYVIQFSITCLIMLQGFLVNKQCWQNKQKWTTTLCNLLQRHNNKSLLTCLIKYLMLQLNLIIPSFSTASQNSQQNQQYHNFLLSIKHCLQKTIQFELQSSQQRLFYVDCLNILNLEWKKLLKKWLGERCLKENYQCIYEVVSLYKKQFTNNQGLRCSDGRKWLSNNDDNDQVQDQQVHIIRQKRHSILISTFELVPQQQIFNIISQKDSFVLTFMHLSTHCPQIKPHHTIDIDSCLNLLTNALLQQQDTYLFYKEKGQMVDIVIRYIGRYYKQFSQQLIMKSAYLIDLLANKCDTIAQECYQLLGMFCQLMGRCYESYLIEFIEISLRNINSNQWQQTTNCYSHIIKLIIGINPIYIFSVNHNQNNQQYQYIQQQQYHMSSQSTIKMFNTFQSIANSIEKQILKMLKMMINSLKNNFDYQQMHQLNIILQYILRHGQCVVNQLTYQDFHFIAHTNFTYEILTTQSADIYFYFTQFSQQKHIFINSVNLYQFWELCESQKLQFFVHVYLKLISPQCRFFTSSEIDKKLNELKKNLWHRFVSEEDEDERGKIVSVFQKHPQQLSSLYEEYHKITLWGQIKNSHSPLNNKNYDYYHNTNNCPPKMQLQ